MNSHLKVNVLCDQSSYLCRFQLIFLCQVVESSFQVCYFRICIFQLSPRILKLGEKMVVREWNPLGCWAVKVNKCICACRPS